MNVLLVEDERAVADFVRRGLKAEGWTVEHVSDGEAALERFADASFDVVVLDLMLPGISGQDVCRLMRARKIYTPVLMLTALDATDERVDGLRLGADDYLTKPFDFGELLARIDSLHRRESVYRATGLDPSLSSGDIAVDRETMLVRCAGEIVDLTAKERDLLILFLANRNRLISRERILNAVWGTSEDPLTNIVDVYVGRLRRKLGEHGERIQTVRGAGYRFLD